jgi:ectoine hydroxylase-related dioxygenase (phytanoyl-CoA dioxygenase family)
MSRTVLTTRHAEELLEDGFAIVPNYLDDRELAAVSADLAVVVPSLEAVRADPAQHGNGQVSRYFPFVADSLNDLVVREDLIDWCAATIGSANLAMSDAQLVSKYGGLVGFDQPLHQDFGNNDLAYPRRDGGFLQVTTILYLTDVGPEDGPTAVVSRRHYGDETTPVLGPRAEGHPLYEHEVPVTCSAGTLFIYDTLTYHRGTAMLNPDGVRHVLFVQYADAAYRWIGKHAYGHRGNSSEMARFMQRATPRQREVIGFPPPGSPYWNAETLAGVRRRYPELDMTPYEAALRALA